MNRNFTESSFPPKQYLVWKKEVEITNITDPTMWQTATGKVFGYIKQNNIQIVGKMSALYLSWDEANGKTELAIGCPVSGVDTLSDPELSIIPVPESKSIMTTVKGAYDKLREAHEEMRNHLLQGGLTWTMAIEEYLVTGMDNPDSSNWETNIYYLYK